MPRLDDDTLVDLQQLVETCLADFVDRDLAEATARISIPRVREAAGVYVTRPSRRLLGMAFLYAALALDRSGDYDLGDLVRVAAALEIRHGAVLLHDDIVDGDTIRGGRPTAHHALADPFGPVEGVSAALFAGDVLAALAPLPILRSGLPDAVRVRVAEVFQDRTALVAAGQVEQLHLDVLRDPLEVTEQGILAVHARQFVPYALLSVELAGVLCGLEDAGLAAVREAGTPLCGAFQVQNDLHGYTELVRVMSEGADAGDVLTLANTSDLARRRRTVLVRAALDRLAPAGRGTLAAYLAGERVDLRTVVELIESTNAADHCRTLIGDLQAQAIRRITAAQALPAVARIALGDTFEYMRALYDPLSTTSSLYLRARPDLAA
ncbi:MULTISPECIES: polyprenyl synthetase family protein [unclassified Streptomyces]|uniref:polyprenyl synthetase family protein n=1 Tax=unclassified Streptomyces TaxID=2593676 RepID=UPI002E2A9471|nr:polyprenyl synthetase family protein [Streptomyces sp. NBC_00223]